MFVHTWEAAWFVLTCTAYLLYRLPFRGHQRCGLTTTWQGRQSSRLFVHGVVKTKRPLFSVETRLVISVEIPPFSFLSPRNHTRTAHHSKPQHTAHSTTEFRNHETILVHEKSRKRNFSIRRFFNRGFSYTSPVFSRQGYLPRRLDYCFLSRGPTCVNRYILVATGEMVALSCYNLRQQ